MIQCYLCGLVETLRNKKYILSLNLELVKTGGYTIFFTHLPPTETVAWVLSDSKLGTGCDLLTVRH
jgi:hypothetical protein